MTQRFVAFFLERERTAKALELALIVAGDAEALRTMVYRLAYTAALHEHRTFTNLSAALHWLKGQCLADRAYFGCGQISVVVTEEHGKQWLRQQYVADDLGIRFAVRFPEPPDAILEVMEVLG